MQIKSLIRKYIQDDGRACFKKGLWIEFVPAGFCPPKGMWGASSAGRGSLSRRDSSPAEVYVLSHANDSSSAHGKQKVCAPPAVAASYTKGTTEETGKGSKERVWLLSKNRSIKVDMHSLEEATTRSQSLRLFFFKYFFVRYLRYLGNNNISLTCATGSVLRSRFVFYRPAPVFFTGASLTS